MPCAAHTNCLKTCKSGREPCPRAICNTDMHRIPSEESADASPTPSPWEWADVPKWLLVSGAAVALFLVLIWSSKL